MLVPGVTSRRKWPSEQEIMFGHVFGNGLPYDCVKLIDGGAPNKTGLL